VARARRAVVVGADLSPAMLTTARQRLGEHRPLVRADAVRLPFRACSFDLVFMSHVLLLVGDIERCVAEVAHSLTAGGWLVATAGSTGWREAMHEVLGTEQLQQLESFCPPVQLHVPLDDDAHAAAACAHSGLHFQWRNAAFSVSWPALEEWVGIRWLTIADDALRDHAERWFANVRQRVAGRTLQFTERLLVAQRGTD
jgi:SAM-dependent methyltransferase